ncbi:MAG: hypothetical protein ACYC2P_02040 [Paludibacteraceae bacterium]
MKKQNFLILAVFAAILGLVSCNQSYKAKEVTLKTQEDSLNYALGVINGESIRGSYFQNDSSKENLAKMIAAADKAFNSTSKDEMYKYGNQIGNMLKQQKKAGLMGDSTLVFNEKLIGQGLVNGMKGFKDGMTPESAQQFIQTTMMKKQQAKMPVQPSAPADTTASAPVKK